MYLKELLQLRFAKDIPTASFILCPLSHVFIRVIPKKIGYEATIWHVGRLADVINLFKRIHVLRYSAVHTHYFFIDQSYQRHMVEHIAVEVRPQFDVVSSFDLIEKAIDPSDCLAFMVAS